ncbi:MAG: CPBP family intramembrane glutamic endopeptidase [Candidatus Helarchaeota archaeon]
MTSLKENLHQKQYFILISTVLLTLLYYFIALYRVYLPPELPYFPEGRSNILFFSWIFGPLFQGSPWIDFWQYIWQFGMAFLLFFIIPVMIIKYYLKEDLKNYGLQRGDQRFNLIWTLIGLAISPIFLFLSDPGLSQEYPLTKLVIGDLSLFIIFNLVYFIYYFGYEFIYRAYLQFGLKNGKPLTKSKLIFILCISTIITTLFHIGKPSTEIIAAAAVGPLFGWLTLRGRSFIWPVLIFHWLIGIAGNIAPLL